LANPPKKRKPLGYLSAGDLNMGERDDVERNRFAAGQSNSRCVSDADASARLSSLFPASRQRRQPAVAETPSTATSMRDDDGISSKQCDASNEQETSSSSQAEFLQSPQYRKALEKYTQGRDSSGSVAAASAHENEEWGDDDELDELTKPNAHDEVIVRRMQMKASDVAHLLLLSLVPSICRRWLKFRRRGAG